MINFQQILRRTPWLSLLAFGGILLIVPTFAHAQSMKCASGMINDPDSPFNSAETDVEQTVCVSSSFSYAVIENDSYETYGDLSTLGVYGVSEEAYLTDQYGSIHSDSGMQNDNTSDTGGSSVEIDPGGVPAGYWITTSYNECMNQAYYYDSDPNQCYWDFAMTGFGVQEPNPPTLAVVSSETPSSNGQSVTFSATLSVSASGESMYFYDGLTQIGTGTINGTTATFTTTSLAVGIHSITASYPGDESYASVTSGAIPQAVGMVYGYVIGPPGGPAGYDGVGNVQSSLDSVTGSWTFGYDSLSRLTNASGSPPVAGNSAYCWQYDDFGNRTNEYGASLPFTSTQPCEPDSSASVTNTWANYTVDGTPYTANNGKNQITATPVGYYTYDGAGDVLNDGTNQYLYDAEGRVCAVYNGSYITGYLYNAMGQRVATGTLSAFACNVGFTPNAEEVYGQDGEELTGVTVSSGLLSWQHTNVYALGSLIATYDQSGLHFLLDDLLGDRRVQTNYTGSVEQSCQNLPFGNGLNCTGSKTTPNNFDFAGLQYDQDSQLEHATARQYSSNVARWTAPDPYDGSMDAGNPQTLNRYAYVTNNPLRSTDPSGLIPFAGTIIVDVFAGGGEVDPLQDILAGTLLGLDVVSDLFLSGIFQAHAPPKGTTVPRPKANPNNQSNACQSKVLNAVNKQFGLNSDSTSVDPSSPIGPQAGGQVNVNIDAANLTPTQFNAIQAGRYAPSGFWGFITGYGPSLHVVAGPSGLDPTALQFSNINNGGMLSAVFTAHIDSAWASNPIGAILHYFIDVRGAATRNPCP
jgi:RHS repeat-associated protein